MSHADEQATSSLVDFIAEVSGEEMLRIEEDYGSGYVRLRISEAERRQAKHDIRSTEDIVIELLRNARDAHAKNIYVATLKEGNHRLLTILDDGDGVPESMRAKIFEPRVTSKLDSALIDEWGLHGRGMALYSIKSNTKRAEVKASLVNGGTSLSVLINLDDLSEKTDQSTFPMLLLNDEGERVIGRGPHNIIRQILEFAFKHRDITVYYGNPTEIAAVINSHAQALENREEFLFCDNAEELPVLSRLGVACDAKDFAQEALNLGLPISERTAHRILNSEIPLIRPLLSRLITSKVDSEKGPEKVDIFKDERGMRFSKQDLSEFTVQLESVFQELADKYMISLDKSPNIRVFKDKIAVSFSFSKDD